jgi:hypothetical protein
MLGQYLIKLVFFINAAYFMYMCEFIRNYFVLLVLNKCESVIISFMV